MFSVNAKPTPTRPAYTRPSRTPSITRRRDQTSSTMNRPFAASSVTGATTVPAHEVGVPSTAWSSSWSTSAAAVATTAPQPKAITSSRTGSGS